MVELVIPATGETDEHTQVLSERYGLPGMMTLDGESVKSMLGLIQGSRIDTDMYITDVTLAEDDTGLDITVVIGTEPRDGVPVEEIKRDLFTRLTARPDTEVRLRLDQPPIRRILARVADVPGYGWQAFTPIPLTQPVTAEQTTGYATADAADATEATTNVAEGTDLPPSDVILSNGTTTVVVDARTGTFSINGLAGFGRLVDGGDHGDTYNYSPPITDSIIDTPDEVTVRIGERGPVRGQRGHQRPIRLARSGRRAPRDEDRQSPGRRDHHGGAPSRRRVGPRAHGVRESLEGPSSPGPPPVARAGNHVACRVRVRRGGAGIDGRRSG